MIRLLTLIAVLSIPAGQATAATLAEIEQRGVLRACVSLINQNLARATPSDCTENCKYEGLIIDQVQLFTDTLDGVASQFIAVNWQDQFKNDAGLVNESKSYEPTLLAENSCDIFASNLASLEWRLSKMAIVPLFENRMMVVIHQRSIDSIRTVDDLAGKSAAVEIESSFHSWVKEQNAGRYSHNPIKMVPAGEDDILDSIISGTVDFTLTDADIAVFYMRDQLAELSIAFAVGEAQQLGWGLSKRAIHLQQAISEFFAEQRSNSNSAMNKAWQSYLDLSIVEFEQLVRSLPSN